MRLHSSRPSPVVEMKVKICSEPFNIWEEIQEYQDTLAKSGNKFGATSLFIGTMRDFNDGETVHSMVLDYYPGMTEKQLHHILDEVGKRWLVVDALIAHRVGEIKPDESIVVVAVWSVHRGDSFDACRYIMETLKSTAPFWKKEKLKSGHTRWVEKNTDGYQKS